MRLHSLLCDEAFRNWQETQQKEQGLAAVTETAGDAFYEGWAAAISVVALVVLKEGKKSND